MLPCVPPVQMPNHVGQPHELNPKDGASISDLMIEVGLVSDVAEAVKSKALQIQLGGALRTMGWVKRQRRVEGKGRMLWFPPVPVQPVEVQPGLETRGGGMHPLFKGRLPATWEEQKIAIKSCIHPTCPTCTDYHRTWDSRSQLFPNGREH
jgi:hypothetical protein